jgi:Uma2 family endonuclease
MIYDRRQVRELEMEAVMAEPQTYAYEIEQGGIIVAGVSGPDHNQVRREIMHYIRQYMSEGPITVRGTDTASLFKVLGKPDERHDSAD